MSNNNNNTFGTWVLIFIILGSISWVCNYLDEQTSRMSGLANTIIGLIIVGVFFLGISINKK